MAGSIKGISIVFEGDTSKLDRALRDVRKSTRDIDSELRKVNQSLRFNPGNVDLLRQKQTLLNQKIEQTEHNLGELKNMQKQVANDPSQGKNSAAYRELQREIIKSENQLKRFNAEQRKIKAALSPLGQFSAKMKDVGTKLTDAGNKMRGLSMAGAAVSGAIGALAVKSGKAADDLNTLSKVTGISTDKLQLYKAAAEQVDVSVESIAKSQKTLKKNMLSASEGGSAADTFKKLGINVKDANGNLRDSDEVFQEALTKLGKMKNETERDAIAMKLMGKSASELNPLIEDGGETYQRVAKLMKDNGLQVVDKKTLDQANQFNDSISDIKTLAMTALQQIGTKLAAYLAPTLAKVAGWIGKVAGWLTQLSPKVLTIAGIIGLVVAAIAPVLLIAGKFAMAISAISSAMALFGVTVSISLGPLALIVGAIAAVIAVGVLLYKNWDKVQARLVGLKNGFVKVWTGIKTKTVAMVNSMKTSITNAFNSIKAKATAIFNAVKNAITNPMKTAISIVRNAINRIKALFSGASFKLPHIKLPHFKLTGKFSLKDLTVPHLSVDWYKTGGIFDSPSIIGVGEAGSEAVVPLDKFWKKLESVNGGTAININVYGAEGQSPRQIAEEVKKALITETNRRRIAWQ